MDPDPRGPKTCGSGGSVRNTDNFGRLLVRISKPKSGFALKLKHGASEARNRDVEGVARSHWRPGGSKWSPGAGGSADQWLRIRITLMRIRVQLFTSIRIRIQLFASMRIRIQLFIPGSGSSFSLHCGSGSSLSLQCKSGSSLSLQCGSGSSCSLNVDPDPATHQRDSNLRPGFHFDPPRLERSWPRTAPFGASKAPEFRI